MVKNMKIIFLGTNGFYNTKLGDTPCVLIDTKKFTFVLDAGNGIYKLKKYVNWAKPTLLFLSHFHLDHIFGLHILTEFKFEKPLTIFTQRGTKKILEFLIDRPFTVPIKNLPYKVKIKEVSEGKYYFPLPFECRYLFHAVPTLGFRFQIGKRKIAYCTDTGDCENLRKLAKNADLLILECSLRPKQETPGWPHLNPETAAKIAKEEKVKKLILTHFGANFYLKKSEKKEAEKVARKIFKNTIAAFDGLEILI
jgi:ribonuclease BN (tRNA processing enzyme)